MIEFKSVPFYKGAEAIRDAFSVLKTALRRFDEFEETQENEIYH